MRSIKILALIAAAAASCAASAQTEQSDNVPYWSGCVIARQFVGDRTIALERVCSNPNRPVSIFQVQHTGARPAMDGTVSPSALHEATLMFNGLRSLHAVGDSRKATLWLHESGPQGASSKFKYELTLTPAQEAIVSMPSGVLLGLRMDPSNVPTPYSTSGYYGVPRMSTTYVAPVAAPASYVPPQVAPSSYAPAQAAPSRAYSRSDAAMVSKPNPGPFPDWPFYIGGGMH